jgi:hypothetical protein
MLLFTTTFPCLYFPLRPLVLRVEKGALLGRWAVPRAPLGIPPPGDALPAARPNSHVDLQSEVELPARAAGGRVPSTSSPPRGRSSSSLHLPPPRAQIHRRCCELGQRHGARAVGLERQSGKRGGATSDILIGGSFVLEPFIPSMNKVSGRPWETHWWFICS